MAMLVSKNFHGVGAGGNNFNNFHQGFSPEKLRKYVLDFFLSPPLTETVGKFPALETSTGVFLADFPWAFIFAFSVLIVELISNMPVSEDEMALTRGRSPCYMRRQFFSYWWPLPWIELLKAVGLAVLNHPGLLSSHCRSRRHNWWLLEDIYGLLYYHYTS